MRRFLAQRFPGEMVNLQLLHGHAAISAELQTMVERLRFAPEALVDIDGEGAVIAAEWFTYRKRGLLAPFGVGTVDQALLAILRARHGFVRLFGLAGKVVIIDEVHAYDTYMSRLLDRLLEWLAALGSPVILLSATLPASRRRELVAAYRRGLGAPAQEPPAVSYPRLTWATAAHVAAQAVQHQGGARSVQVVPLPASSRLGDLGGRLADALRDGGCAVVICNTVGRAQQVYQALKPLFSGRADDDFPVLDLLHARYLVDEREERERRVRGRFGKPSESVRPNRAVLVATQVVEQSLDLDFDLLVTDLAPADLVLQRAGRLHRHERPRPAPLAAPTLWLLMPDLDPSGQLALDRADLAVYGEHVLLRSWLALRDRRSILLPEEIEPLVEAVYGEGTPDALPEPLRQQWQRSEHAHREALAKDDEEAKRRWIPAPLAPVSVWSLGGPALAEEDPTFHQDHQALTRLAEPAVEVVLLTASPVGPRLPDGRIVDLANTPDLELTRTLLRRSVRISHRRVAPALLSEPAPAGWARSALLRNARLLVLDEAGSAPLPGGGTLRLDPELGVVVEGE
ncbi:MAG: CRISPR-associated helicase Cas3' [Dehalococcoidia bacterium]|nr:CRISPR-associated helicase Cas3' [Dehalococcoidia bacterium]